MHKMVTELLIVGCLSRPCLIYNVFLNICNNVELVISEQNENMRSLIVFIIVLLKL